MKRIIFILFCILCFSTWTTFLAQQPAQGFFIGGNLSILMLNGEGTTGRGLDEQDLDVSDDLFTMDVSDTYYTLDWEYEYPGWGWDSKLLTGLQPVVGYKISPQFAVFGTYNYYFSKNTDQSDRYTSSNYYYSPYIIGTNAEMEYSQTSIHLLAQYYPLIENSFSLFLQAGVEFVFMSGEMNIEWTDGQPGYMYGPYSWRAKGSDNTTGFVFGGGIEFPALAPNMSIVASVLYSFSNYKSDELLVVKKSPGPISDPNMPIELGVGGFSGNAGVRIYFPVAQAPGATQQ